MIFPAMDAEDKEMIPMSQPSTRLFRRTGAVLAVVLLAALAAPSPAQVRGKIEGTITDAAGRPLDKVAVVILSLRTSAKIELSTGKDGRFTQIGLEPGYFQVALSRPGFVGRTLELKVNIDDVTKFEIKLEAAEAALERALSDADRQFVKGNKLYADGQYGGAVEAYKEAARLNALQWAYHFNLGLAQKKLGQVPEAQTAFAKARELNPSSYAANKELAESLVRAGKTEEAGTYFLKAAEISPDDPDALYNLGVIQAATGDGAAAAISLEKCLELKPDYVEAYYQLGTVEVGLNKVQQAVNHLEKFLELAPDHDKAPIARQLVGALKK